MNTELHPAIDLEWTYPENDPSGSMLEWLLSAEVVRPAGIESVRNIRDRMAAKVFTWGNDGDGVVVDAQTANMLVTVYEALWPEMQAKVDRMIAASPGQFSKIVKVCWSCVK